jgi:hypothetical protein
VGTHSTLLDVKTIDSIGHKPVSGIWIFPPIDKEPKKVWSSRIVLYKCVPEVVDFKEFVLWCVNKFDTK